MNHQGQVTCRGMLIENTIYKRGETLNAFHREMILMYRPLLDGITAGGWVALSSGSFHFVTLSLDDPPFLHQIKS
mgnify:FL=1